MAARSTIEWTESTWNPLTGCTKISPGCANCYAERLSKRLKAMGNHNYSNGFNITMHEDTLELPFKWRKPQNIFVNSMSDLFHEKVPDEYIFKVFNVMRSATWHRFQILTKRSERLLDISPKLPWMPHIWMGVSVENQDYIYRINHLRRTGAKIKFLSLEPLIGNISALPLIDIDWVIVGGESGPKSRPLIDSWVTDIRNQCLEKSVPFFFKQWGGVNRQKTGRKLEGRTWDEMPSLLPQTA
jgi:protein gp37